MASERDLKAGFRRALDEVVPPAPWLEAATIEDLRQRRASKWVNPRAGQPPQTSWPRSLVPLAAGVLIVLVAAAALAAFLGLRNLGPQSSPAGTDVKAYEMMVGADAYDASALGHGDTCQTLLSTCPAPGRPVQTAYRRWLDDLNRSTTPPKFAVIDAQMRRHLAAAISDLDSMFAAYQARDQGGLDSANSALHLQAGWLELVGTSIAISRAGTFAAYIESVQAGKDNLGACPPCQSLASTNENDCTQMQSPTSAGCVINAMSTIEVLDASVVRHAAPSSLAAQDAGLQRDLAQADTGILAMMNAELTGDQSGFKAGRILYEQALPAINADIAGILGG